MVGMLGGLGLVAGAINPVALGSAVLGGGTQVFNSWLNWKNYQNQVDQQNYNKNLQNQMFAREDNAVFRRRQDLINSGMSPVLASGQGASAGSIVSTKAPEAQPIPDMGLELMSILKMAQDMSMTSSQKDLISQQIQKQATENKIANLDFQAYKRTGYNPRNASTFGKWLTEGTGAVGSRIIDDIKSKYQNYLNNMKPVQPKPRNFQEPKGGLKEKPEWMNKADWEFYKENRRK
ncbi:MAG: DNA pilot protein [Arizlama microvirus]|nr:MAG: DNA pilot protein [Arizlama microvirus]